MLSRRGFLGALAGLLVVPGRVVARLRPCSHDFDIGLNVCRKCGITLRQMWINAYKNTPMQDYADQRIKSFGFYTNYPTLLALKEAMNDQ